MLLSNEIRKSDSDDDVKKRVLENVLVLIQSE